MYEPKRIPSLDAKTAPLPEIRYGIQKSDQFVDLEDPTIDPLHIHGYLEIFFSICAEVSFLVNDTLYPVSRGDALNWTVMWLLLVVISPLPRSKRVMFRTSASVSFSTS